VPVQTSQKPRSRKRYGSRKFRVLGLDVDKHKGRPE